MTKMDGPINMGKFLVAHGAKSKKSAAPHVWLDPYHGKPYGSPLSGKVVTSRHERKEEMKRFNVREVEPSEGPHRDRTRYTNPDFVEKYRPPTER